MINKTLYLTVGLPRSGKSTWAMKNPMKAPVVNPDSIRLALHGEKYIQQAEGFVWAIAHKMVESLFIAGHNAVVLDATNTTRKARDAWRGCDTCVKWVRRYVMFGASRETCIVRAMQGEREDLVPVITRMFEQYNPIEDDELMEGESWFFGSVEGGLLKPTVQSSQNKMN